MVLAKAKSEQKYILLDCYTSWCGPCKFMNDSIFTRQDVGDYVNEHFVSFRIQLDTNKIDNDYVRSQYTAAHSFLISFKINTFPTYLFFDSNGQIVHRAVGASAIPVEFITKAQDALNPDKQYYGMINQYKAGRRDSLMLIKLASLSRSFGDEDFSEIIGNEYFKVVKDIYGKNNLTFIGQFTKNSSDSGFIMYIQHPKLVDSVMGKYYAERKVMNIIMDEDSDIIAVRRRATEGMIYKGTIGGQALYDKNPDKGLKEPLDPCWGAIYAHIRHEYGPYYADRITKWTKLSYYGQRQNWGKYINSIMEYVNRYNYDIKTDQLNGYAWDIFQHSSKRENLNVALHWSSITLEGNKMSVNQSQYLDTYANILYKLGKKESAIKIEEKAVQNARPQDKDDFKSTLDKMKENVVTSTDNP